MGKWSWGTNGVTGWCAMLGHVVSLAEAGKMPWDTWACTRGKEAYGMLRRAFFFFLGKVNGLRDVEVVKTYRMGAGD